MVDIYVLNVRQPLVAKEGYFTIKKRLYDFNDFIEVTVNKKKIILNKNSVKKVEAH